MKLITITKTVNKMISLLLTNLVELGDEEKGEN